MPLSLGNIILLKEKGGMRESVPRQVDKKSRGPQGREGGLGLLRRREGSGVLEEEIEVWNSQGGGKDKYLFFPIYIP